MSAGLLRQTGYWHSFSCDHLTTGATAVFNKHMEDTFGVLCEAGVRKDPTTIGVAPGKDVAG